MLIADFLVSTLKVLIGVTARWESTPDFTRQRIYFSNHTSHMDTLAIMSALPWSVRRKTKPVAAADYWGRNRAMSFISQTGLNAVLIDRKPEPGTHSLAPVVAELEAGNSVIIFPEGTRGSEALPGPFKSGIYRLHQQFPEVDLVPIYLENMHRSLPKGKRVPLPIMCTIRIGDPITMIPYEAKEDFLVRAREAIVRLSE